MKCETKWCSHLRVWRAMLVGILVAAPASVASDSSDFFGLYVPEGQSCDDSAQLSENVDDLRAGYIIYDREGRKSTDTTCDYAQVQALRQTGLQILDLDCSYDGSSFGYRQVVGKMGDNRMIAINSRDGFVSYQVLTYCDPIPKAE